MRRLILVVLIAVLVTPLTASAGTWTQWRHDHPIHLRAPYFNPEAPTLRQVQALVRFLRKDHAVRGHRWGSFLVEQRRLAALEAVKAAPPAPPAPVYSGSIATLICSVFGPYCSQAVAVATCESGLDYTQRGGTGGDYWGLFQFGSYARATYGFAWDPGVQTRAAYAYFAASGYTWSAWSCKP